MKRKKKKKLYSEAIYQDISEGYYDISIKDGSKVQKFWLKKRFLEISKQIKGQNLNVLDLGCGPGTLLYLNHKKIKKGIGLDISKKQIKYAKEKFFGNKNLEWIRGDIKQIEKIDLKFDYIILSEVIEHIKKRKVKVILDNIKKKLKKNGKLLITTPNYLSFWPIQEILWSKFGKIDYLEQHISKFTFFSIDEFFSKIGYKTVNKKSFFIITPFLAIFSIRIAKLLYKVEKKILPFFGSIIIIKFKKK